MKTKRYPVTGASLEPTLEALRVAMDAIERTAPRGIMFGEFAKADPVYGSIRAGYLKILDAQMRLEQMKAR
jgi:hypothetical protein